MCFVVHFYDIINSFVDTFVCLFVCCFMFHISTKAI